MAEAYRGSGAVWACGWLSDSFRTRFLPPDSSPPFPCPSSSSEGGSSDCCPQPGVQPVGSLLASGFGVSLVLSIDGQVLVSSSTSSSHASTTTGCVSFKPALLEEVELDKGASDLSREVVSGAATDSTFLLATGTGKVLELTLFDDCDEAQGPLQAQERQITEGSTAEGITAEVSTTEEITAEGMTAEGTSTGETTKEGTGMFGREPAEDSHPEGRKRWHGHLEEVSPSGGWPAPVRQVAAGQHHCLALTDSGLVFGWGCGWEGQLGQGHPVKMVSSPVRIDLTDSLSFPAPHTDVNGDPSLCRPEDKELQGQERGTTWDRSAVAFAATLASASASGSASAVAAASIACGSRHSIVITGEMHSSCASTFACLCASVVAEDGDVFTFGWGLYGQCGHGNTDNVMAPTHVAPLRGVPMKQAAAGIWHTLALSRDGDLYSWGGNQFGQLGIGSTCAQTAPELVDSLAMEHQSVVSISAGARHCLAVAERGQIFAWGWNKYGQLGLGDTEDRLTPTRVRLHESPSPPLVEKKSAGGRKLVMATLAGSVDLRSSLSVPLDKEGVQVLKVSCGAWHSTMLVENHTSC